VVSGIALTKGDMWGRGDFGWHHRFVWPAFGLLVALAVWRLVVRDAMSRTGLCLYLVLMLLASGFVAAAGYFGGELLLSGGGVPGILFDRRLGCSEHSYSFFSIRLAPSHRTREQGAECPDRHHKESAAAGLLAESK
jgi:hypothetical protein